MIIDALRSRLGRRDWLSQMLDEGNSFAVSVTSVGEVYAGIRPNEEAETAKFFNRVDLLPVTPQIARQAGRLKRNYARRGRTLGLPDMFIAATAIEHGLLLLTDNRKHFDLPELTLYPLP